MKKVYSKQFTYKGQQVNYFNKLREGVKAGKLEFAWMETNENGYMCFWIYA